MQAKYVLVVRTTTMSAPAFHYLCNYCACHSHVAPGDLKSYRKLTDAERAGITCQACGDDDDDTSACSQCGDTTDDGEGYDGMCGNCADKLCEQK